MTRKLTYGDCVSKELFSIRKIRFQRCQPKTKRVKKIIPGKGLIQSFDNILPQRDKNGNLDRLNIPPRLLIPLECEVDREV